MYLILAHPAHAAIDCKQCQLFLHDKDFKPIIRGGQKIKRYKGSHAPCFYGADKCPKGNPLAGSDLTEKNTRAYLHYLECKAVGDFPDDAIVRRNAAAIRVAEDRFEQRQRYEAAALAAGRMA